MDIKTLLLETLTQNEEFREEYCKECNSITTIPGDMINPPETNCHCDFDIMDSTCVKSAMWQEIESLAEAIAETAGV